MLEPPDLSSRRRRSARPRGKSPASIRAARVDHLWRDLREPLVFGGLVFGDPDLVKGRLIAVHISYRNRSYTLRSFGLLHHLQLFSHSALGQSHDLLAPVQRAHSRADAAASTCLSPSIPAPLNRSTEPAPLLARRLEA
jgi:hypothetical protein